MRLAKLLVGPGSELPLPNNSVNYLNKHVMKTIWKVLFLAAIILSSCEDPNSDILEKDNVVLNGGEPDGCKDNECE